MAQRKNTRGTSSSASADGSDMGKAMADSAQKIWLAGLGAFERAKAEGPKMFDTLVEQGKDLTEKARDAADQALRSVRESAGTAGGRFDKLEQVFEDRVSKSLNRLGVLTRGEVSDLSKQVQELTEDVRRMMAQARSGPASRGGTSARSAGAQRGAAKRKVKRAATKVKRKAKSTARRATRG